MTLLKSSTCCLNVGSVKWVDGPLELCLLNEILVYKWNFYVFTRELVLINKINMSFAHDWVIINLGQGEWWLGAILCMPPPPPPIQCIVDHMGTHTVHCWSHGYAKLCVILPCNFSVKGHENLFRTSSPGLVLLSFYLAFCTPTFTGLNIFM